MKLAKAIKMNITELKKQDYSKTSIDFIRSPYYSFSDGVSNLTAATRKLRSDKKMADLIESLKNIEHEIIMHLNQHYNWD